MTKELKEFSIIWPFKYHYFHKTLQMIFNYFHNLSNVDFKWIEMSLMFIPLGFPSIFIVWKLYCVNFHETAINKYVSFVLILNGEIDFINFFFHECDVAAIVVPFITGGRILLIVDDESEHLEVRCRLDRTFSLVFVGSFLSWSAASIIFRFMKSKC